MSRAALLTVAVLACCALVFAAPVIDHGSNWNVQPGDIEAWFAEGGYPLTGKEGVPEFRQKLLKRVLGWAVDEFTKEEHFEEVKKIVNHRFDDDETVEDLKHLLDLAINAKGDDVSPMERDSEGNYQSITATSYPYFGFIPPYLSSLMPGGSEYKWATDCWGTNTAIASAPKADGSVTLTFTVADQKKLFCSDSYLMASAGGIHLGFKLTAAGTHTLTWNTTGYSTAETYDLKTKGVRLMHFTDNGLTLIGQIIDTALMFMPMTTKGVSDAAAKRNMQFLKDYADVTMNPRNVSSIELDPSYIKSGDFFGIIRLDGLDPMLGWAMGSTTGHTTTAIWDQGELYIAESTANDSYWPTNGIQRTPYKQWVEQATAAGFNVVHVPLSEEYRAKYNVTAALEFFEKTEGLNYGYHNMFFGWIDTVKDNYPCTPPDFSSKCLQWELVGPAFAFIDKALPSLANQFYAQALNFRIGTQGLTTAEVYMTAEQKGMNYDVIPTIVEEDAWKYNTTRYGKPAVGESMVCCVFVCHMWKAAGVFGDFTDEVNCGELTNFDDYTLDIFSKTAAMPAECKAADPGNPVCQFLGADSLWLKEYNIKTPYAHMAEHCPSEAPKYIRPGNC